MKKILSCVAMLALLLSCASAAMLMPSADAESDGYYHGKRTNTVLWDPQCDDGKYPQHRIPGIVVTKKDTVIVYCEARTGDTSNSLKKAHDWCLMDIYIQRSEDGGKTFGDPIYIAKGNRTTACVNNPVMIVGNDNTLHMLYCKNYSLNGGGLWYRRSTDDGLTWSEPRNVTQFASNEVKFDCFAFGPTHGICTRDGVLMSPVWMVHEGTGRDGNKTDHGPSVGYVFYSTDNGETWQLSERTNKNVGEMCIVELSDGGLCLNSRATGYRKVTASASVEKGWTTTYVDQQLPDPACCGGMVTVDLPGLPYAHLFTNCASTTERSDVTLRVSFDDCVTWEQPLLIDDYFGGYTDVAVDSKGKVYVIYEKNLGVHVKLFTCSFADEFLKNADEARVSDRTAFTFADDTSLSMTNGLNNLQESVNEGALRLVATGTRKHSLQLSFKELTENLNLTRTPVMAMKLRVSTDTTNVMQLDGYVISGRIDQFTKEKYWSANVPADGEWHTVLVDLRAFNVEGDLSSMRLELFADTLTCREGDSVDLEFLRFFENEETAKAALGINSSEGTEPPATNAPEHNSAAEEGCQSSSSAWLSGIVGMLAVAPTLWKRRKKD